MLYLLLAALMFTLLALYAHLTRTPNTPTPLVSAAPVLEVVAPAVGASVVEPGRPTHGPWATHSARCGCTWCR